MGTNKFGANIKEVYKTIGPSAPPIMATEAASPIGNPIFTPITNVTKVPISAKIATIILAQGLANTKPISLIAPIPKKTKQAINPLLKVRL